MADEAQEENTVQEQSAASRSEGKAKRIAVGATVGGVLLAFFLLVLLIISIVQVVTASKERDRLLESIEEYKTSIEHDEKELDDYLNGNGLYHLAVKQGWKSKQ